MKILICGGALKESQANAQVRTSIADGWTELLGASNVASANIAGVGTVIAEFRPNLVLGIGSYLPETTYFGELSRDARQFGAVPVFWATEDPYEQDASYRIARDFEAIFSCDRSGVNFYGHPRVHHLPLAGCRQRHYIAVDRSPEKSIDVMFCGVAFASRIEIVSDLRPSIAGLRAQFIGPGWGQFGPGFSDRRIEKAELIQLYAKSKIVLNLGRSLHFENKRYMIVPSTPGPRTFEAALAGTVQLFHEETFEIRQYFTKAEIPSFSTKAEFEAHLQRFLNDPEARYTTATSAQERALSEHTYAHRAQHMINTLRADGLI